ADRLGFLQQLQDNLGFEGGSVRLFHVAILPNPGALTVQILGSTIFCRRLECKPACCFYDASRRQRWTLRRWDIHRITRCSWRSPRKLVTTDVATLSTSAIPTALRRPLPVPTIYCVADAI